MKIIQNIIPGVKLYHALRYLNKFKAEAARAKAAGDYPAEQAAILNSTSTWGKHLMKIFEVELQVQGRENLPEKGPVVYVSNHQGYGDIPVFCAILDTIQFGFVARNDLEKVPLYGNWIKRIRSVMIQRDDARASLRAIEEGIGLIEKGFSLLIFPEGTRSKGAAMREFKKGSLRLATKPGVPVIPLTINGTWHLFEETGAAKKGVRVNVVIHPPIETAHMGKAEAAALSESVEALIRQTLETLETEESL